VNQTCKYFSLHICNPYPSPSSSPGAILQATNLLGIGISMSCQISTFGYLKTAFWFSAVQKCAHIHGVRICMGRNVCTVHVTKVEHVFMYFQLATAQFFVRHFVLYNCRSRERAVEVLIMPRWLRRCNNFRGFFSQTGILFIYYAAMGGDGGAVSCFAC
jgi:hypothetical protein